METRGAARSWGRLGGSVATCVAVALLVCAGPAFACVNSVILMVQPVSVPAGATATLSGQSFDGAPSASPVTVRFNGFTGPVLWSGHPGANGSFSASFTVPEEPPGYYMVIATQNDAAGNAVFGTPAHGELQIVASTQPSSSPAASSGSPGSSGASSSASPPPQQSPVVYQAPQVQPQVQAPVTQAATPSPGATVSPAAPAQVAAGTSAAGASTPAAPASQAQTKAGSSAGQALVQNAPTSVTGPLAASPAWHLAASGLPWLVLSLGLAGLMVMSEL